MAFEAGTVVARFQLAGKGFAEGIRKAEDATQGLSQGLDKVSQSFGRVAAVSAAAFAAMAAGLGLAARTGAQFEESMINVGAVTGATSDQLKTLSNIAVETGEATIFSATEVGQAMFNLGSQGVKTAKQFRDVLAPSLDLAAATQTDVNFASRALLASIRAFGQPLSEATRFANVFSAANENSALTAEILDRALRPVGATASAIGADFEETTAILGGLINAGLTAERAGTGLKTAFALLLKPSGEATKELEKLGISEKTIAELIKDPIKLFKLFAERGLDAAQAFKIFGTEGGPAVLAITKQIPSIEKLNVSIRGTDSAARIAAEQLKATTAKFKLFGSAVTSVAIRLFDGLQPAINAAIEGATKIAKVVAAWIKDNEKLAAGIAIATTALAGAVAVMTGLVAVAAAAGAAILGITISMKGFSAALKGAGVNLTGFRKRIKLLGGKDIPLLSKALRTGNTKLLAITKGSIAGKAGMIGMAAGVGVLLGRWINSFPFMDKFFGKLGDIVSKTKEGNAVTGTASEVNKKMTNRMIALTDVVKKFASDQDAAAMAVKDFGDISLGKLETDKDAIRILEILNKRIETRTRLTKEAAAAEAEAAAAKRQSKAEGFSPEEQQAELDMQQQHIQAELGFMNQRIAGGQIILTQKDLEGEKQTSLIEKIGQAINLEGKFSQAIDGVLAGTRGVGESLGVLIKQIGLSIVKALILQGIMLAIKAIFGKGFIGKALGFKEGGVIGAQVGLLPAREDRLIAVQDGESVLNRDATAALGREGVNALNDGGQAGGGTVINLTQKFEAPLGFTRDGLEALREANSQLRLDFAGGT